MAAAEGQLFLAQRVAPLERIEARAGRAQRVEDNAFHPNESVLIQRNSGSPLQVT